MFSDAKLAASLTPPPARDSALLWWTRAAAHSDWATGPLTEVFALVEPALAACGDLTHVTCELDGRLARGSGASVQQRLYGQLPRAGFVAALAEDAVSPCSAAA